MPARPSIFSLISSTDLNLPQHTNAVNRRIRFEATYPDGSYARTISLSHDAGILLRRVLAEQFAPPIPIIAPLVAELELAGIALRHAAVTGPDGRVAKTLALKTSDVIREVVH